MQTIHFVTSNPVKLKVAQVVCAQVGINVVQVALDIDEIQGEDPERIVTDKAQRAYEQLGKPLVVSDDTWDIPALNGFPGAYMKSMNEWLTAHDFLRLMHGIEDRRVILHQYLAYTDGTTTEIYQNSIPGTIIHEARGHDPKTPSMTIIALDPDGGKTIAEVFEQDEPALASRYKNRPGVWHGFIEKHSDG